MDVLPVHQHTNFGVDLFSLLQPFVDSLGNANPSELLSSSDRLHRLGSVAHIEYKVHRVFHIG